MSPGRVRRRTVIVRAALVAGSVGLAGCLGDGEERDPRGEYVEATYRDSEPAYDGWFDPVDHYEGTLALTGRDQIRIGVGSGGGLSFTPPAVAIDPGTTVVWEWTGRGGEHNVVETDDRFASDLVDEAGHRFRHRFDDPGLFRYMCTPHVALGMRGAVWIPD